mmetsp:Transcript_5374/g.8328  ORF Transcript_5374/g.8328 Transcript_5374/m.8328 type:complete len:112 (+) Transcript_5374:56-391(+)|eukprot:CAMPEP_0203748200 /NCGR_PEP_ID=MMETSP0098-20131031/3139_1 /ASSEMBLY_ACC=CAM_ASM_000208 /TAXON_ID=96639 /ORGANISM=" , Strain NY0313808BC1" /LENGTH=111 /DNA_ID=CAMNT_0050636851 /DNA_START=34 /DNA_END=369 /DNA_ORIENTATION=-
MSSLRVCARPLARATESLCRSRMAGQFAKKSNVGIAFKDFGNGCKTSGLTTGSFGDVASHIGGAVRAHGARAAAAVMSNTMGGVGVPASNVSLSVALLDVLMISSAPIKDR